MSTTNMTYTPQREGGGDSFSWRRVGSLYEYYLPTIRTQVLIYLAVSLVTALVVVIPMHDIIKLLLFSAFSSALTYMFTLSPCIFSHQGDTRIIERLLPASAAEKLTFFVSYLLLLGVLLYLPTYLGLWNYSRLPWGENGMFGEMTRINTSSPWLMCIANILSSLLCLFLCLYVIMKAKRNRVLKAVLAVVGTQIVIGFFTGMALGVASDPSNNDVVIGAGMTPHSAFLAGLKNSIEASQEMMENLASHPGPFIAINIIMAAATVWLLWAVWRQLGHKNL